MPPRASASTSSPTSSSVPRRPAPSKKRMTPSSCGGWPRSAANRAPSRGSREEPLVELAERPLKRVDEACMSRRAGVAVELRIVHDSADEECLLQASQAATQALGAADKTLEQIVEGADRAAEERR